MAVMFDPNIPGGFPSGYGGASGAETGAVGGGMSGVAGGLMGAGIVLDAARGGGPWRGISKFLGRFGSGLQPDPAGAFSTSLNTALNKRGLGTYRTYGKAGAGERKKVLSEVVRAAFAKWGDSFSQYEYEEMFRDIERFVPNITVQDAIKDRDYYVLNPEESDAWVTPEEMKKMKGSGKTRASQNNLNLLYLRDIARSKLERNPDIKDLHRKGKAYNPEVQTKGWRTDETVKRTIDNVKKSIDNNTFLPAGWAAQEQPPVQEQPTQERSLAENAFNAFKGIGIGSAITRNVFNPKRLPRPDLGFGFQKLFSRQY